MFTVSFFSFGVHYEHSITFLWAINFSSLVNRLRFVGRIVHWKSSYFSYFMPYYGSSGGAYHNWALGLFDYMAR